MYSRRPPSAILTQRKEQVLARDGQACSRCTTAIDKRTVYLDPISVTPPISFALSNLRALCRRCYLLRCVPGRQGMVAKALADGVIDANWRNETWE